MKLSKRIYKVSGPPTMRGQRVRIKAWKSSIESGLCFPESLAYHYPDIDKIYVVSEIVNLPGCHQVQLGKSYWVEAKDLEVVA